MSADKKAKPEPLIRYVGFTQVPDHSTRLADAASRLHARVEAARVMFNSDMQRAVDEFHDSTTDL